MENVKRAVALDATQVHFESQREVDSAIDTVVTFAFGNGEPIDRYLARVREALPSRPSVKELVETVFRVRGEQGPIPEEASRRDNAAMAMAAFLTADPSEMGLPAAMFRLGPEIWLTPSRTPLS